MAENDEMSAPRLTSLVSLALPLAIASVALSASIAACDSATTAPGGAGDVEGGVEPADDAGNDAFTSDDDGATTDGGADTTLDGPREARARDANGPGADGDPCSFNFDCQSALRCECAESTGCACKTGVRGMGRNGIGSCANGDACESAVCVEGPPDSGLWCSDECATSADCVGKLPLCATIAFVGRVCIRDPGL